jgi:energy-coupling factor transporter ATP-binding protein EcfA2
MLAVNLYEHIMHGEYPQRKVHHISYMSPDAVYLWSAPHRMLKITTSAIEEVGVGTDGVLLQAEHIAPFPSLDELKPRIEALRPRLGDAVTKLNPGTPLSAVYTTRWSSESHLLPEQARQMVFTRFLFVPAASRYTLWPLVLITGPEDSGKSTLLEIGIAFFTGKHEEIVVDTLPSKIDSFYASVTNSSYLHYDNIDDPKHTVLTSEYNNLICQLATGAKLPIRVLHRDNEKRDYPVKVHASFTAGACPFERSAVMRRCLHFEVTNTGKEIDKMKILNTVLDNRADLLAEYLLRTQNMLRAHIANAEKEYELISGMAEYERFTLICADYEGALAEMQAIWQAYASMYRETISNPNQLVYALRLWLGQDLARAGKQYPAETLYFAVQRLYQSLGQKFGYETVGTFGRAIAKQLNSLSVIGIRKKRAKRGILYTFEPSAKELSICCSAYEDVRPGITTSSTPANPPMEFETEELMRTLKWASRCRRP